MDDSTFEACGVGALLAAADGRLLMQLRDDRPSVSMAGHWGLFGGMVEREETPAAALLRELREELDFTPREQPTFFSQIAFDLRFAGHGLQRKLFFEVPITDEAVHGMQLSEGQSMQFLSAADLLQKERVVPWDLYAVILYARRQALRAALRPSGRR